MQPGQAQAAGKRELLRHFHVCGRGLEEAMPEEGFAELLARAISIPPLESLYPLYVNVENSQTAVRPLAELVEPAVRSLSIAGKVRDLLMQGFAGALGETQCAEFSPVCDQVIDSLPAALSLSKEDAPGLAAGLKTLREGLPRSGWLIDFGPAAPALLYGVAVNARRRRARQMLRQRVATTLIRLRERLWADQSRSPQAVSPESLAASMGIEGDEFLCTDRLAEALKGALPSAAPGAPARGTRMESAAATLEDYLAEEREAPAFWVLHSGRAPAEIELLGGRSRPSDDPCADAIDFTRQLLERMEAVLRALRYAGLECDGVFDPALHEPALSRFDWRAAEAEELTALPPIVVLESESRLLRSWLTSFARLLRSGLPIHVLLCSQGLDISEPGAIMADAGALALAHRQALVEHGSLAQPALLMEGFTQMADTLRPAVAVCAAPSEQERRARAWMQTVAVHLSGAFPVYRYNPDLGESWAERFRLCADLRRQEVTAAHAAALFPGFRSHFRIVEEPLWNDEQIEIREYLAQWRSLPPKAIPFLAFSGAGGAPNRAILTRELAYLSRECAAAYRMLEEMAGIGNSFVERAVAQTRAEMEQRLAQRENELAARFRQEGARNAVARIVAALTSPQAALDATRTSGRPGPPALGRSRSDEPVSPSAVEQTAPVEAVSAPVETPSEAYIDSFLCTSCNDCMKVNPRAFQYDANKQAYLADPAAATYAELVRAAEACPAKCIHPGLPRPGDATATPEIMARAAKLR